MLYKQLINLSQCTCKVDKYLYCRWRDSEFSGSSKKVHHHAVCSHHSHQPGAYEVQQVPGWDSPPNSKLAKTQPLPYFTNCCTRAWGSWTMLTTNVKSVASRYSHNARKQLYLQSSGNPQLSTTLNECCQARPVTFSLAGDWKKNS